MTTPGINPSRRKFPRLVSSAVLVALSVAGCNEKDLHVQNDDWANPELALKVSVPESATDVAKGLGSGNDGYAYKIDFLMPNDEWRGYLASYYPNSIRQSKIARNNEGLIPAACTRAFRDGVTFRAWVAEDRIRYFDSDKSSTRHVSVLTDCKPNLALVQWRLYNPSPKAGGS